MSPRRAIDFFRTRKTGAFVLFLVLLAGGFFLVKGFADQGRASKQEVELATAGRAESAMPRTVETISRDMTAFNPPKEEDPQPEPLAPQPKPKEGKTQGLAPISLYADSSPQQAGAEQLSEDFAPFGRLIQCELVITVDSAAIETPIVGLVTDDVWHNGRLIVPAGTEVHGIARVDPVRERIASAGSWNLVWQSGEEMSLSGLALDREMEPDGAGWGITDGSAGLRGYLIKSDDLAEIKLFAASFLSGAAGALTEKQQTLLGTQNLPSLQNAPFAGAQQVLNVYAQQILNSIQRDGFYVRVPAGKQFYLYTTQTLDKSKATVGGTRRPGLVTPEAAPSESRDSVADLRAQLQRRYGQSAQSPDERLTLFPAEASTANADLPIK